METCIQVDNLLITDSNRKKLIDNISFKVPSGASVGIVGESGSGKSLTMKFLLGFLPSGLNAEADELNVLGSNPYKLKRKEHLRFVGEKIGYIPQNTVEYLHPLIKIKDQISDGYQYNFRIDKQTAIKNSLALLEQVEINNPEKVMDSLPHELSGGMRQRVNISMAMMTNPELLIADEPTTALDAEIQYQVMELLLKMHQERNNTMIIISHDLGLIKNYCDYVIVLYNGVIQEFGTKEDIFNNPKALYTKALLSVQLGLNQDKNLPLKDISYFLGEEVIL